MTWNILLTTDVPIPTLKASESGYKELPLRVQAPTFPALLKTLDISVHVALPTASESSAYPLFAPLVNLSVEVVRLFRVELPLTFKFKVLTNELTDNEELEDLLVALVT